MNLVRVGDVIPKGVVGNMATPPISKECALPYQHISSDMRRM